MGMTEETEMNLLQVIRKKIEEDLPESLVEVSDMTGTNDHFQILVVSDVFKGKALLEQHRLVMDILREGLRGHIHAVKIKTLTKDKYEELRR